MYAETLDYDIESVNRTGIVHLVAPCQPDTGLASCGAALRGIDAEGQPLDCLVCAELARTLEACPHCGEVYE